MKGQHTKIQPHRRPYSAFIIEDYGFTHMQVINYSHVHIQQISDDKVISTLGCVLFICLIYCFRFILICRRDKLWMIFT